jgi:RimJ/RimL family protein N-acetyltransferase
MDTGNPPSSRSSGVYGRAVPGFTLRELVPADAQWIAEACTDAEILRWTLVPRPYTLAHAEQFVVDRAGELAVWVITDSTGSRGAGVISIHRIDEETGTADIGYWVAPWARRRGAASTAVRELVRAASAMGNVRFLAALIAETNTASRRVVESAGFAPVGPTGTGADGGSAAGTCPDGDAEVTALRYVLPI